MPPLPLIAPSMLAADFAHLARDVEAVTQGGADSIHWDVMDGSFVPNLTFGPCVIGALRSVTDLPFDAHLMVRNPRTLFSACRDAGCQIVTIHADASDDVQADLKAIRALGMRAGVAFNPKDSLDSLAALLPLIDVVLILTVEAGFGGQRFQPLFDKIRSARALIDNVRAPLELEVDGGVTDANATEIIRAGADILVSGTFIFKQGPTHYASAIQALKGIKEYAA